MTGATICALAAVVIVGLFAVVMIRFVRWAEGRA